LIFPLPLTMLEFKKKGKMKSFVVDLFTEATASVASMEATPLDFW
jgi:hypothetical protein